ncbi:hypothetical protein, partial [Acinetobacter baumannii]|uniref:hypothetical protein n=1 Tax=Acinetobacter baumannii TaxID=470 RepID=UPI001C077795
VLQKHVFSLKIHQDKHYRGNKTPSLCSILQGFMNKQTFLNLIAKFESGSGGYLLTLQMKM